MFINNVQEELKKTEWEKLQFPLKVNELMDIFNCILQIFL